MTQPTVPSVKEQIQSGIDLSDLKLPGAPSVGVSQWEETSPLTVEDHELLREYVFRWINLKHRERAGLGGWQVVTGDLATAVRRCGVVTALVGGDEDGSEILNGDLVLAWMPRTIADKRNLFYQEKRQRIREAVIEQGQVDDDIASSRFLKKEGRVERYSGPLQE